MMATVKLSVADMACDGCVSAVRSALSEVDGVTRADVSLEAKTAEVDLEDGGSVERLIEAVSAAGYKAAVAD
jgi:copper chaperone CopZ